MSAHDEQQAKILEAAMHEEWQPSDCPLLDWHQALHAGAAALRRASPETGWQPNSGLNGYCAICYHALDRCSYCDQGRGLLGDRVLLELKRIALSDMADGLESYVVANGADHDEDCPADDTCSCSQKPIHDAVNSACRLIRAMSETGGNQGAQEPAKATSVSEAPNNSTSNGHDAPTEVPHAED